MEYIKGTFLREQKTRFLCDVLVEDKEVECYIPSSCKMSRLVDLTGKEVILRPIANKKSRTDYSVYAARFGRNYVLLNLAEANRVVENQMNRRFFSFLGKRKNIFKEKVIEGYKTDLYVEDTNTIIEIKTLLSFDQEGSFPSMVSERAENQLKKLSQLLDRKYRVYYFIISLNPTIEKIKLNEDFGVYCDSFHNCLNKGMICKAYSVSITQKMELSISKSIEVLI